jgi:DDE family transposase
MKTEEIGPSRLVACARVPDVRSRHGRRSPLPALLTLATAALLCGARSLYASAQWGRRPPPAVRRAWGVHESALPAATTRQDAFKRVDTAGCEMALPAWTAGALGPADRQVVLDGKALRGRHGEELPGVRLVAL